MRATVIEPTWLGEIMDDVVKEQIKRKELPTGFKCTCGTAQLYHAYVYAHWQEPLLFTCPYCRSQWEVLRGRAKLVRKS